MHADEYRELATKAAGRATPVKVVTGAAVEPADAPAPTAEDVKRQRLMREAQREPAVQEALDLFGARLVDVREAKPSSER
jgi:hypothetical protein